MWIAARRQLKRLWVPAIVRAWPLARGWYRLWGLPLDGAPDEQVWYFAYGANMHDDVFRGRRRMQPLLWRIGRVRGYRLRFNLEGRPKGKAAPANISADPHAELWGVLYLITRRQMVWLNSTEGVPGWRYRPIWLEAEDETGKPLPVFTYIADGADEDGNPSKRYVTLLREGARAHRLPAHWLDHLDRVKSAE
jgi:cation transport regulator ChaC